MMHEKPVLILSENLDYHGVAVRWGLQEMGVPFAWWERTEFPRTQLVSSWVSTENSRMTASGSDVSLSTHCYRTVWNRRGEVPQASESLHHTDKVVARNESTYFLGGLARMLADANPAAMFVNAFENAKAANPKIHQLNVARSVGFKIPKTLVSNNPEHIREFFEHNNGMIVAKQHIPFAWRTMRGALLVTGTSAVLREHLVSDEALSACPMIYQEKLQFRNELRIVAFGRSMFALNQVRTQSPAIANGFVDIRYENAEKHAITVDESLMALCHAYMDRLGLTYAAFDIVQLLNGDYVFLEANEAGQFLFLENEAPELTILDAFCQFLASGDPLFRYKKSTGLKLTDFEKTEEANQFHMRYETHIKVSELTSPFELVE